MCFSRLDTLTDMQHDLELSCDLTGLDLRSNFDIDLFMSTCIYFDAFRPEEHDCVQNMSLAFLVKSYL